MSEDQETMTSETETKPKAKRNSIPRAEVDTLVAGIPQYEKTSFLMVGHRDGVRLAIPKTLTGVSRVYFYGNDDYTLVPELPGIQVFDKTARKDLRKGGIMAEVDFDVGLEVAVAALKALIEVVRAAPAPAPKAVKKPKLPKEPKLPFDAQGMQIAEDEAVDPSVDGTPDA